MSESTSQLKIGAALDGSFETATSTAKRKIGELGATANDAGKSLAGMGNGTAQSAQKIESATKSMIQSIQRTTAATEAGDKSTRAYQESLARMRGIDVAALKPYLDQLDAAKSKAANAAIANESFAASFAGIRNAALIASAAVGSFAIAFKKINDGVDALNDLKDATGASIENISALENVARRTGGSFDTVSTALVKLNQGLNSAKEGSGTEMAIKAIGLSVADLKKLDPAEAFRQTAVALSGFSDDANKARLTQELFGKSLKEIAPLLNDVAESGELVATVTTQQAKEAEILNKQLATLSKTAQDAARSLVGNMVPAINEVIAAMKKGGILAGLDTLGNQLFDWEGNANRKGIKNLESDLKSLREQQSLITIDIFGKKGAIQQEIDTKIAMLAAAKASYFKLTEGVGGGRGSVNPALVDARESVGDLAGTKAVKESTKAIKENTDARRIQDERIRLSRALVTADGKAVEDANDAYKKMMDDLSKANDKYIEGLNKSADSIAENVLKLNDEEVALRISTEQKISLAQAIEGITIKRLEEKRVMELIGNNDAAAQAIAREIEQRKLLANAIDSKDARAAVTKSAADAAAEWKKTSDSINSTLTDALMRGFESGKDFARNLRDTVVNMFKTMVLRPVISAVMSPISGALMGGLGLSGAANAAGGASAASTAMSGISLAMSSFGGSFMSGLSTTFASGFSTLGLAVEGGLASIATGTATGISAGIGQALGAVAGPLAIGAGVLAAVGAFRTTKQTGTGISGTLGDDTSLTGFDEMRKSGYLFGGPKYWDEIKALDPLMAKALKTDFANIKAAATGAADALGLASTEVAGFNKAFRIEFTGDKAKDEALYTELMSGTADDLAKTILGSYKEAITTVTEEIASGAFWDSGESLTSTVTRQVTNSSYTPSEFAKDGETASQTLARLATSITLVNSTSDLLGNALLSVGLSGANTASLLIDAFGGAEAYASSMGSYYTNFYSQAERTANLTTRTAAGFAALGLTMPMLDGGARAAYRSMVEIAAGQDMTVAANRTAYASLLALQGPMNELAPAFDDAAQSARDARTAWLDLAKATATASKAAATAALDIAKNAADAAYAALERSVGAQRQIADIALSVAQEQVSAITSVFDTLKSNVQSLYGAVDSTSAMQAAQGNAFIMQALATAQASGYLPDNAELADAIAGAMGGINKEQFASQADADFSRLVLAGKLSALQDISGVQLTEGQKALKAAEAQTVSLDAILQTARDQIDVANGIDISVISVVDAVNLVNESVRTLISVQASSADASRMASIKEYIQSVYSTDSPALEKSGLEKISATAKEYGVSMADVARSMGLSLTSVQDLYTRFGVAWQSSIGLISGSGGVVAGASGAGVKSSGVSTAGLLSFGGGSGGSASTPSTGYGKEYTNAGDAYYTVKTPLAYADSGYASLGQYYITSPEEVSRLDSIAASVSAIGVATPDAIAQLASTAQQYGVSMQDLATASGYKIADVQALFAGQGIPAFAVGTNYVPNDGLAYLHEGEAVVPKAYNPMAGGSGTSSARLESLVEGLTKEVQRLQAIVDDGNRNTRRTADAVNGNPEMPMLVEVAA